MAKTATERSREMRRRREQELKLLLDSSYPFLKQPFFEWIGEKRDGGDWEAGLQHFDLSALVRPEFEDDSGPHSIDGEFERGWQDNPADNLYLGYEGSIGRAERLVDDLIGAAHCFASVINRYKKEQITERIKEIEASDLTDPGTRKQALKDIVRLQKMLERLEKQTRHAFPEYQLKGI
ncbi:hypothetical protein K7H91_12215 [Martelella mediterranea]|uniref:hypothetical protein n=1 Tax=Martelella mediterranea TaxID=293089 RepID=UPI001E3649AC|nr:hypothetical protein [Martelella mediterranea]MCD1634537.1 hypothetical protein [Martelella mediterranea]